MKLLALNLFVSICMFFNALGFNTFREPLITQGQKVTPEINATLIPEITPTIDQTPKDADSTPAVTATDLASQTTTATVTQTAIPAVTSTATEAPLPTTVPTDLPSSTPTISPTPAPTTQPGVYPIINGQKESNFKVSIKPLYLPSNKQSI